MDQVALWMGLAGILVPVILVFVGWAFNRIITKKIDDLEQGRKDDKILFFDQLNGLRNSIEKDYVRRDLYEQALKFQNEKHDDKFNILTQKIAELKEIMEKLNLKKTGSDT